MSVRARFIHLLPKMESYKWCHHSGGMAESLDGSIGALLEVVVVAWHVEGGERGAAALHGSSQSGGCQRHAQSAVRGQGALDGVGQGSGAGTHGR